MIASAGVADDREADTDTEPRAIGRLARSTRLPAIAAAALLLAHGGPVAVGGVAADLSMGQRAVDPPRFSRPVLGEPALMAPHDPLGGVVAGDADASAALPGQAGVMAHVDVLAAPATTRTPQLTADDMHPLGDRAIAIPAVAQRVDPPVGPAPATLAVITLAAAALLTGKTKRRRVHR